MELEIAATVTVAKWSRQYSGRSQFSSSYPIADKSCLFNDLVRVKYINFDFHINLSMKMNIEILIEARLSL